MVPNLHPSPQAGKYARFELERRFLLDHLPGDSGPGKPMVDRYVEGSRLRLRQAGSEYKLSQKEAHAPPDFAVTTITTIYLSPEEFEIVSVLPGRELCKRRYHLGPYSIDVFEGSLEGLILAERSYASEEEMRADAPPEFAVREVSDDVRYTGGWLAANGLPE
jgi:CYTH domain-containing protein